VIIGYFFGGEGERGAGNFARLLKKRGLGNNVFGSSDGKW